MEVSWNRATPTSSILMVFCIINHPFGGTPISWAFLWGIYWTVFWSPQTPHVTQDATDLRHVIGAAEALSTITRDTASTAGKHAVAWQKNAGNHSRSAALFIMLSGYIYISCTYINTYMYTSYFQTRPKCDVVWFDLIWMVLDAAWQWRPLQRLDQARHWYLWFLAVKPHVQRRGASRELLENVEHTQHG